MTLFVVLLTLSGLATLCGFVIALSNSYRSLHAKFVASEEERRRLAMRLERLSMGDGRYRAMVLAYMDLEKSLRLAIKDLDRDMADVDKFGTFPEAHN